MTRLGNLEAAIMDELWTTGKSATVRDVLERLRANREIAYTTVMTVMDNLYRKGWLQRERDGRAYRYQPLFDRHDYTARLLAEALNSTADREGALLRFVEQMGDEESGALRAALQRVHRKPRKK